EQISQLAKKLIRLHAPDAEDAALSALVTRLTTELYSHSHLISRAEAAAFGLPVEEPPSDVEDRLLAYYDQLKTDLELLEKFDPAALLQRQRQPRRHVPVVLERAYAETPTTCDAFVTRGMVSESPGSQAATLEATSERWETVA